MVNSLFATMYAQLSFSEIPDATEKAVLDLLLPYVKSMKYRALLVMTTKDHVRIHVLLRFPEPTRKDHLIERFVRNVYSAFTMPPGKKARDYVTIGHKMLASDYTDVTEVLFNDRWGPAPFTETIEVLEEKLRRLQEQLRPLILEEAELKNRIVWMKTEEARKSKPRHTHGPGVPYASA